MQSKKARLGRRLLVATVLPVVVGMGILWLVLSSLLHRELASVLASTRQDQEQAVTARLKSDVEIVIALLQDFERRGVSKDEAMRQVSVLRFGKSNAYVWIHSFDPQHPERPRMVMHPTLPQLDGQDLSGFVDTERFNSIYYDGEVHAKGDPAIAGIPSTRLFVAMNRVCADQGGGVVRYYWPKPKGSGATDEGYLKLSYVELFRPWNWVIGTGEYADNIDAVVAAERTALSANYNHLVRTSMGVLLLVTLALLVTGAVFTRVTVRPIQAVRDMVRGIAEGEGDLTQRLTVPSRDELGEMAEWLNAFLATLQGLIARVGDASNSLAAAASELMETASSISELSADSSQQSSAVSASAEQISSNLDGVTAALQQMGASIREISRNGTAVAGVANKALNLAEGASHSMEELASSSEEIGNVVRMITSIAEQTNLLALNATIEAARAGAAGKGFAVVANEVKELATSTAEATRSIDDRVTAIQQNTGTALEAITEVTETIREMHSITHVIATAVEEQTATTAEIGRSLTEVSSGSGEIAQRITGVAQALESVAAAATATQSSATGVAEMSTELAELLTRFTY